MKFIHRLKYFFLGFGIGLMLVFFFFKDRGWDWLPNNRVLKFILTNPINIDENLNKLLSESSIETDLIFKIIENGDVNFSESQTTEKIKNYKIEYDTSKLKILVSFKDSLSTVISLNNFKPKLNGNHRTLPLYPSDELFFTKILKKEIKSSDLFLCQINKYEINFNLIQKQLNKSKLIKEFSQPYKKPNPIYYCLLPINDKQILIQMEEGSDKLRLKNAIINFENQKLETLIEKLKKQKCD
ncbi:MAG: hypothetical protein CL846_03890 [Crocinitomicaceae bacterium]|nr:hypothetical protein [Crocinitomicaceae bacterium]|tara:strand:- start:8010 stop:8732 length:723 start_codon:yes stop_codon:yes gene_type:complete